MQACFASYLLVRQGRLSQFIVLTACTSVACCRAFLCSNQHQQEMQRAVQQGSSRLKQALPTWTQVQRSSGKRLCSRTAQAKQHRRQQQQAQQSQQLLQRLRLPQQQQQQQRTRLQQQVPNPWL